MNDRFDWDGACRRTGLIGRTPSAAIGAYHHARYWAGTSSDNADRDLYDRVALVIGATAAMIGIVVD